MGYNLLGVMDANGNVVAANSVNAGDKGGITSATSPGTGMFRGSVSLSDHYGLSAEINVDAERCNPVRAAVIKPVDTCANNTCQPSHFCSTGVPCSGNQDCTACLGSVPGNLVAPGTAQWYRIDDPGTYTFSVNPNDNTGAGPDNGLEYLVYLPEDLSRPIAPFGVSTTHSDPPGDCDESLNGPGCPYDGYTYTVPSAPFYVKVFSQVYDPGSSTPYGTPWPKDYTFRWQRSNCEEPTQACVILPTQVYSAVWEKNASDKKYFQMYVDRSDSGDRQTLRFDAKVEGPTVWLRSISVRDQNDAQVGAADSTPAAYGPDWRWQLFSDNNTSDPAESVGTLDGDQELYYLVVEKNTSLSPEDFAFEVRWDTSLAWVQGAAHSWPGTVNWGLALWGETQDDCRYPFCKVHDEIEIRYEGDDRNYTAFGYSTNHVGVSQGSFANDQGWTSIRLTGSPYGDITNAYGENVRFRNALRVVDHFGLQIREDDGGFNGAADLSGRAYFRPVTAASTLGAGVPDPATADRYRPELKSSGGSLHLGDEGHYEARVNVTGAVLAHFCLHGAKQCGMSGKFCCDNTSFVCLDKPPAINAGGYCQ